jgi:hypothetical protein
VLLTKSPLQSSNRLGVSAAGALRQIVEVLRFVCNFGPWICTYKCALRVWPDLDGHSNQELRYA